MKIETLVDVGDANQWRSMKYRGHKMILYLMKILLVAVMQLGILEGGVVVQLYFIYSN